MTAWRCGSNTKCLISETSAFFYVFPRLSEILKASLIFVWSCLFLTHKGDFERKLVWDSTYFLRKEWDAGLMPLLTNEPPGESKKAGQKPLWKILIKRLVSFWDSHFSGASHLNFGGVVPQQSQWLRGEILEVPIDSGWIFDVFVSQQFVQIIATSAEVTPNGALVRVSHT